MQKKVKVTTMPLNTHIQRDGKLLSLRWGNFHVAAMALAASFDEGTGVIGTPDKVYDGKTFPDYPEKPFPISDNLAFMLTDYGALSNTPLNNGSYTLTKRHQFVDVVDGEILELLPGDILGAYQ
jgi:hypothetical protein